MEAAFQDPIVGIHFVVDLRALLEMEQSCKWH